MPISSILMEMKYSKYKFPPRFNSVAQHAIQNSAEMLDGSVLLGTECLNTRFAGSLYLPIYLYAGYTKKLKKHIL